MWTSVFHGESELSQKFVSSSDVCVVRSLHSFSAAFAFPHLLQLGM